MSDRNPYSPPSAPVQDVVPEAAGVANGPLYLPRQLFLASFLGSAIAAAWFAAANYRALAQPDAARRVLVYGVIATVMLLALAFVLPDNMPGFALPLLYSLGIQSFAEFKFGKTIKAHLAAGGSAGPWGRLVGISLLWGLGVFGVVFAAVYGFTLVEGPVQ